MVLWLQSPEPLWDAWGDTAGLGASSLPSGPRQTLGGAGLSCPYGPVYSHCCFNPLSFGVVCYAEIDTLTVCVLVEGRLTTCFPRAPEGPLQVCLALTHPPPCALPALAAYVLVTRGPAARGAHATTSPGVAQASRACRAPGIPRAGQR